MYNPTYFPRQRWNIPKEQDRNFIAAFFHMATIALTCTSLAQLGWFRLRGGLCVPHLAVYQFFSYGYFDTNSAQNDMLTANEVVTYPYYPNGTLQCVTSEIANLMRIIILLCFMAMISSLIGFFLDIVGPTRKILKVIRRNGIPSTLTVVWVVIIIGVCYYVTLLLEAAVREMHPGYKVHVSYEYGCYTITAAGVVAVFATACNLFQQYGPPGEETQRRRLIDDWDGLETFSVGSEGLDTPLESIPPPPPYTP